jgi:hypothetical protein
MPFLKYVPEIFLKDKNTTIHRKINQYTNWNIIMIMINYILNNYFEINNSLISKFIALNSLQIFLMYHIIVLYDCRILFDIVDNSKPFILKIGRYNDIMIYTEYFIINILIHIMPVYFYYGYIFNTLPCGVDINMCLYTVLFKFMWALNIFGNFDVMSIYLPSCNICSIKIFNTALIFDYVSNYIIQNMSK